MNNPHGITAENLLRTLPVGIGWDETIQALAASIAEVLSRRPEEISRLLIYSNIDHLDEELLDILAYDFKVDWWDGDYSLEEKRRTLKDSWRVHRMLGTKAAVETAISAIYPNSVVKEWFEYGGRPYYFKLEINVTDADGDLDKQRRVLQRINYYKNLRSHLDSVDYTIDLPPTTLYLGGAVGTLAELGIPEKPNTYDFKHTLHVGGTSGMHTQTSVPEAPNHLDFTGALHVGGNGGIHVTIPPDAAPPPFSIQRMGNVCTIIMDPPEGS